LSRYEEHEIYEEDLTMKVLGNVEGVVKTFFQATYFGTMEYNTSFHLVLSKEIHIPKGVECSVEIYPQKGAKYQRISGTTFKDYNNVRGAKLYSRNMILVSKEWRDHDPRHNIIKSLVLVPATQEPACK